MPQAEQDAEKVLFVISSEARDLLFFSAPKKQQIPRANPALRNDRVRVFPQPMKPMLLKPHSWDHGHAWTQTIEALLSWLETNPNGQTLDDFHVIPCGVFWRKQTGNRTGRSGHGFDRSIEILIEGVHGNLDGLARVHFSELAFLEVSRYPKIAEIGNRDQAFTSADVFAHFHRPLADYARDGRDDLAIA